MRTKGRPQSGNIDDRRGQPPVQAAPRPSFADFAKDPKRPTIKEIETYTKAHQEWLRNPLRPSMHTGDRRWQPDIRMEQVGQPSPQSQGGGATADFTTRGRSGSSNIEDRSNEGKATKWPNMRSVAPPDQSYRGLVLGRLTDRSTAKRTPAENIKIFGFDTGAETLWGRKHPAAESQSVNVAKSATDNAKTGAIVPATRGQTAIPDENDPRGARERPSGGVKSRQAARTSLTPAELNVLAYTLLGEAGGEGKEGMAAVMNVIMNRAESGRYSSNPAAVAIQSDGKGIHQFSTWNTKANGGNSPISSYGKDSASFKQALELVQAALAGNLPDTTGGATHFYSTTMKEKPSWFDSEAPEGAIQIGKHVFGAREQQPGNKPIEGLGGLSSNQKNAITGLRDQEKRLAEPAPTPAVRGAAVTTAAREAKSGGLTTRPVQTIDIDERTGEPITVIQAAASREATRLAEIRRQLNTNDKVGEAARGPDAAAPGKTGRDGRIQPADLVGEAAKATPENTAAAGKESRGGSTADATPVQGKLAAPGEGLTPQQKAAIASTTGVAAVKPSGVQRTTGGIAGTVAMPPGARPASVPDYVPPKPVTTFKAVKSGPVTPSGASISKEARNAIAGTSGTVPGIGLQKPAPLQTPNIRSKEDRDAAAEARMGASIAPTVPTPEEIATIADTPPVKGGGAPARTRQPGVQPNGYVYNPPAPALSVAQQIIMAAQSSKDYTPEQQAAILAGKKSYQPAGIPVLLPTTSVTGKPRRSYGDSSVYGSGGSILG